ncbi:ATP-binding protein [Vibrio metschnikovii]|uniref:AlbA family DNA-binding domain-containing protein n=1 Tax=Vibrio metschnikovii TaxID=28172 RepID=UPI002A58C551|nr:ATP-binding protein [Vibrio metschnikovii]
MEKNIHEEFTKFFENPTRETLRKLLKNSYGEMNHMDFKEILPQMNKLAKHFLAFANHGGGVLIIGIKETSTPEAVGVKSVIDKADITKGISKYLPSTLKYMVLDFSYDTSDYNQLIGKTFQVILVESCAHELPYVCKKSGTELREGAIYVRRGTSSCEATHDEVQQIISKRVDTQYSTTGDLDLDEHLNQLKSLYKQLPKETDKLHSVLMNKLKAQSRYTALIGGFGTDDEIESYDDFIQKTIIEKKKTICHFLNINT